MALRIRGMEWSWEGNHFLFTDDTDLVADSAEKLNTFKLKFENVNQRRKLKVKVGKSEVTNYRNLEGNELFRLNRV